MTDNEIIKALELCANRTINSCKLCPCNSGIECNKKLNEGTLDLINRQKAEIEKLNKFKSYFDDLYGKGLEVANWHLNGSTEPFDNFYESALGETEDGKITEKEYIEREAVLMLCQDFIDSHEDGSWRWVNAVTDKDIMNIPSADVVEVVRCKDCEFSGSCSIEEFDCMKPDDYCSKGKRKENDNG